MASTQGRHTSSDSMQQIVVEHRGDTVIRGY